MPPGDNNPDRSTSLLTRLVERIQRDGPMPLDAYMLACAADREHGYWNRPQTLGAGGDFITSPEISQVFGELIGLWSAVVWQQLGSPESFRLVELGPGRGTLMRDALRAARIMPGFLDAASVHLVEVSDRLRQTQRETVGNVPRIAWHADVAEVPDGPAIFLANEFLDALPIHQLVCDNDGAWRERVVALDARDGLKFAAGEPVAFNSVRAAGPGAIAELRPGEDALLATLADRASPLVALFIDYGPAGPAMGDTLQAVQRHRYVDPLAEPGRADLTAHVLFADLAAKAKAAGLAAAGPITQAEFLGRLGVAERAARLMAANPKRAGEIEAGVQRLMAPGGMGQLFKVLAVHSRALPPPPPFS